MSTTFHTERVNTSHLIDETRCKCGHPRHGHGLRGNVCLVDIAEGESSEFCPCNEFVECQHPEAKRVGGISGDFWIGGSFQAVDVTNYKCPTCGDEWSD